MVIDHKHLNDSTLASIIEQFLHREDHSMGNEEKDLAATITLIKKMLDQGEMHLTFDAHTESVNILTTEQLHQLETENETENEPT